MFTCTRHHKLCMSLSCEPSNIIIITLFYHYFGGHFMPLLESRQYEDNRKCGEWDMRNNMQPRSPRCKPEATCFMVCILIPRLTPRELLMWTIFRNGETVCQKILSKKAKILKESENVIWFCVQKYVGMDAHHWITIIGVYSTHGGNVLLTLGLLLKGNLLKG